MHIDRRLMGWGAFLVIAGALPLLVRAGVLAPESLGGWASLWPVLIIGAGLGLLLRRTPLHLLGGAVSAITAGVMAGGLLATGFHGVPGFGTCGTGSNATAFPDRGGQLADPGSMTIAFNCGSLDVSTTDGDQWSLTGTGPSRWAPVVAPDPARVQLSSPEDRGIGIADGASTWHVRIPRTPSVNLSVTLNAGEGTIDFAGARVGSLNLTLNAGSLQADLAGTAAAQSVNATVNAGSAELGLPASLVAANFTLNAGSLTVCVPDGAPLRVTWSGTIADNNLDAFGLVRVDDDHWTSAGLDASSPATNLSVSANAGSFTLKIGGSCDA